MNLCECGGEIYIQYDSQARFGTHYIATCKDCGGMYPLVANSRIDAVKEWNEIVSAPWSTKQEESK